jgi:hypothetical protein
MIRTFSLNSKNISKRDKSFYAFADFRPPRISKENLAAIGAKVMRNPSSKKMKLLKTANEKNLAFANLTKQNIKEKKNLDWKVTRQDEDTANYNMTQTNSIHSQDVTPLSKNVKVQQGLMNIQLKLDPKLFSEKHTLAAPSIYSITDSEEMATVKPKRVKTAKILMNDKIMTAAANVTSYGVVNLYNKGLFI